jgi:hydrogenase maturation protein HypF
VIQRLHLEIQGTVQGVGFRPFVYQIATDLGLMGWVKNTTSGVIIEVEGGRSPLNLFIEKLKCELPPHASIERLVTTELKPFSFEEFTIKASQSGLKTAIVLPDLATCSACIADIFDPENRRFHYPFTNCTHCGPRYSIIETLPYDRPLTSMVDFSMCVDCQREYENPGDRRFHAQPNACSNCGCQLEFWGQKGEVIAQKEAALNTTIKAIQAGKIIAIKGLGGFHLVVDARNFKAVERLRQRKQRPTKPFAVMYPNLALLKADCKVSKTEENLLLSAAAPIVLLHKKGDIAIVQNVAPNNPYLGAMLPYMPLHHLLLNALNFPIIATSGNLTDEPICIDELNALKRLAHVADYFLVHNRRILRPVDDSVVRVVNQKPLPKNLILRRSRGYVPSPMPLNYDLSHSILALGSHLKNAVAITQKNRIFLSQHIGDLSNQLTFEAMENTLQKLSQIYDFKPEVITCDLHPDYLSTKYAQNLSQELNIPLLPIQHHKAHIYACIAEHQIDLLNVPVLGVVWDGTGYGEDGTIWGGEFFVVNHQNCQRIAHLKPFPLIGGDRSAREPRRSALGLLSTYFDLAELKDDELPTFKAFSQAEFSLIMSMLAQNINSPLTSSMGRVFDAIASLLDLHQTTSFEGQAAMALEFLIGDLQIDDRYNFKLNSQQEVLQINLKLMLQAIIQDLKNEINKSLIAAKFHNTLVEIILAIAHHTFSLGLNPEKRIILTGGCFQNKYLLERSIEKLTAANFQVYYPQQFPCNDGGIALGQVIAAHMQIANKK